MPDHPSAARFPNTDLPLVERVGGAAGSAEARDALATICREYWYPLYAHARRLGLAPGDADDCVQGLLADLIERGDLALFDPARGRFRTFLRSACEHHLAHRREREAARKRGGGRRIVSIDRPAAEGRYGREPSHERTADRLYERAWALSLLEVTLRRLGDEEGRAGRAALFDALKPALEGDRGASHRAVGAALGMAEGAVRVAAHRLRRRYREVLRDEVGRTGVAPAEVDAELTDLIAALGSGGGGRRALESEDPA